MSRGWRRTGCVALVVTAAAACYDTRSTRVDLRIPTTALDCVETTHRVFGEAGYVRVDQVRGPNFFYTPQVYLRMGLRWGIGVWLESSDRGRDESRCDFQLQALSTDEGCMIQCDLTPHPGADADRAVQDLAARLGAAFHERRASE
jgi:hypothetical protein